MEIERKYLVKSIPENLDSYSQKIIQQAYLSTEPVLRIRKSNDRYIFTYKSAGLMSREEIEAPLTKEAYEYLLPKADGNIITKTRYDIPMENNLKIELDIFDGCFMGLIIAEVEFPDEESAVAFTPPDWFGKDVTFSTDYHNSTLSLIDPVEFMKKQSVL